MSGKILKLDLNKKTSLILAAVILFFWVLSYFIDGATISTADIGILIGTLAAVIFWFIPVLLIDKLKIRVQNPRDKFVEPSAIRLVVYGLVSMTATAVCSFIILATIAIFNVNFFDNLEGVVESAILIFILLSIVCAPVSLYMINALVRYKRIVEYKSSEWKKIYKNLNNKAQ